MKLTLLRHGDTAGSRDDLYYGAADIPVLPDSLEMLAERAKTGVYPTAAAGIAAAVTAVAAIAADAERPAHDLLTLCAGGVLDEQRLHRRTPLLSRHGQHILHENAVALCGVVQQHMGHSAHDPSVLEDRAAAHG
mgnify:CR=1 FL=1